MPTSHGYFETALFRHELADDEIDKVVLGADCAAWFKTRLRDIAHTGEPVQEDWGWALPVIVEGWKFWFMLQRWHTTELGWHIWIEQRGFILLGSSRMQSRAAGNRLKEFIDGVLSDDPQVSALRWVGGPEDLE